VFVRLLNNTRHPEQARKRFDMEIDRFVASIEPPISNDRFELLKQSTELMREKIQGVFEVVLPQFIPTLGPGMASLTLLTRFAGDKADLALEITRGLPDNVTTQMDLALWDVAVKIRESKSALNLFESSKASELATRYLKGSLPAEMSGPIDTFLAEYGMRGIGEIDIGRPRWREDPTPVFQTLRSYLNVRSENAPDLVFQRGEQAAQDAIDKLCQIVKDQRFGRIKARLVRAAARRLRAFLGARESPKFLAIQTMGIIRQALLESGKKFVEAGTIKEPDDLFFLYTDELQALSEGYERDWVALIDQRRRGYDRERRRKLVPRVLASDGRAFFEGVGAATDTEHSISGSPVSPGVVEATVRIVFDPHETNLAPGEILVCPGTDPAWTPLFLAAGGLITEVGGMMTHGSVVAREYGIPAVVGVHEATTVLSNGQRIRLDGSSGTITLLDETG
jgi:pyruvate,water dikinase